MGKKDEKKNQTEDIKSDQPLQAILLADSFEKNFRPITLERPKVLLPLVNTPMLEYTLEFLSQNGVGEVFIFCVWHADILQEYVAKSKWSSLLSVRCISSSSCTSAGDALRELDSLGVIRSDPFVLISGDVISNIDLQKAIAFHLERRKMDPDAVMTIALKSIQRDVVGIKSLFDDLIVGMDRKTNQLLMFDNCYDKSSVLMPKELIIEHPSTSFRTDMLDCHVDICSPEFMLQLSDNFDYQDIRHDFIRNEVVNWELGKHIYGYIIDKEYAARVQDPRTYHNISRDIVTRWTYPMVPDSHLIKGSEYTHYKPYNYRGSNCSIARSISLSDCVVLGNDCTVGDNSSIMKSIIGKNCVIMDNVTIIDSHIWDGCIIESGAKIIKAILADNVVIKKNATVSSGCILSFNTVLGEGVVLPANTRISLKLQDDDLDSATTVSGQESKGYIWTAVADADEVLEDEVNMSVFIKGHSIGCADLEESRRKRWHHVPIPTEESDSEDDSDTDSLSNRDDTGDHSRQVTTDFDIVASDMIISGYHENNPPENVLLEIKGYKFAQNKSYSDCVKAIFSPLLSICLEKCSTQASVLKAISKLLKPTEDDADDGWCYVILGAFIQDDEDELTLLFALEDFVVNSQSNLINAALFRFVLQVFYDSELVSEAMFSSWIAERRDSEDLPKAKYNLFREPIVQQFIDWIEEESDDEDDEDDEAEDDDD